MANIYVDASWAGKVTGDKVSVNGVEYTIGTDAFADIQSAVNVASITEKTTITLAAGTYAGDVKITLAEIGAQKADIAFAAAEGADVKITGKVTVGYRNQGVGAAMWNAEVSFDGVTFDCSQAGGRHALDVQEVKSFVLNDCTIVGDGEYGIVSPRGNGTQNVDITGCTFKDASIQSWGFFSHNLTIDNCIFNEAYINVQSGEAPPRVLNSTFNKTLKDSHIGDSFYVIRTNNNPIIVEGCTFNIDSKLTEAAENQAKWGVLWARNDSDAAWGVTDIEVNLTDAAMAQTALMVTKNGVTSEAKSDRIAINGLTSTSNEVADLIAKTEGYVNVIANGAYTTYQNGEVVETLTSEVVYVNAAYAGKAFGENINGKIIGYNAFGNLEEALAAASTNSLVTRIEVESNITQSELSYTGYYKISQKLTIGVAGSEEITVSFAKNLNLQANGDGASVKIEDGLVIQGLGVVADGFATNNESMIIDGAISAISLKVWTSNNGIIVNETGKVALGLGDGQLDWAYGNGFLTVNGTLANTEDASLTAGPQFKAGYSGTRGNGNTMNLNNTYFEGGAWFNVNGSNGTFNLNNSVLKVSGGDAVGSFSMSNSGNVVNVENGSRFIVNTVTVGEGNTINVNGSSLEFVSLTNNGAVNVYGESTLNITTAAGGSIDFMDGAIIKDSTIGGSVFVAGNVTFRGDNTFGMLYDYGTLTDYYGTTANMAWTVEAGASLTLTNKARYGLGYGDTVAVYGNIAAGGADAARAALSDDDASNDVKSSLFMHGLVAQENTGWNCDSSFTVKNAYVQIGSNNSFGNKPGNYGGTYTFLFDNAVLDASRITFYEALSQTTFTFKDSNVNCGTFMTRDADSVFTLDNTVLLSTTTTNGTDEGNYQAGLLKITNGSSLTYSAEMVNTGTIVIDGTSTLNGTWINNANGTIIIDAAGITELTKVIDLNGNAALTGKVTVENLAAGMDYILADDGDVIIAQTGVIKVDAALTGTAVGADLGNGFVFGVNAFASLEDITDAASKGICKVVYTAAKAGSVTLTGEAYTTYKFNGRNSYVLAGQDKTVEVVAGANVFEFTNARGDFAFSGGAEQDVVDTDTLYVNKNWGENEELGEGLVYGTNAFTKFSDIGEGLSKGVRTITYIAEGNGTLELTITGQTYTTYKINGRSSYVFAGAAKTVEIEVAAGQQYEITFTNNNGDYMLASDFKPETGLVNGGINLEDNVVAGATKVSTGSFTDWVGAEDNIDWFELTGFEAKRTTFTLEVVDGEGRAAATLYAMGADGELAKVRTWSTRTSSSIALDMSTDNQYFIKVTGTENSTYTMQLA